MRYVFAAPHVVVKSNLSSMKTNHTLNVHSVTENTLEELKELNQEAFDEVKEEMQKDAASYIKDQLKNAFKGNKHIKIK